MVTTPYEPAAPEFVAWLLDTGVVWQVGDRVSTISAAIREARALTGRNPATGVEPPGNEHRATWAGALVWFIVLEQLGTCFRPSCADDRSCGDEIVCALVWFADVDWSVAIELAALRDRFAHDYSLEHPRRSRRYRLTARTDAPLLKRHNQRPEVSLYQLAETAERTPFAPCEALRTRARSRLGSTVVPPRSSGATRCS